LKGDRTFQRGKDFYYFEGKYLEAIRSGDWKLRIALYQGPGLPNNASLAPELYNLAVDPTERVNQADRHPDIVAELKAKLIDFKLPGGEQRFK